jgi:hypothetical protein
MASTRTSSSLYLGREGWGFGKSFIDRPGWWKRPVGKYCWRSMRKRAPSLRLNTNWETVSVTTSRSKEDAILDSCGTV